MSIPPTTLLRARAIGAIAPFVTVAITCFSVAGLAIAQTTGIGNTQDGRLVRLQASLRLRSTLTDNVFYSSTNQQSDIVAEATPTLAARVDGDRLKVNARAALQGYAYLLGNADPTLRPVGSGNASLEAIEDFFFIDARANISPVFVSPLGPRAADNGIASDNRAYSQTLAISPYIRGKLLGDYSYNVRFEQIWNSSTSASYVNTNSASLRGRLESAVRLFGWSLDASHYEVQYPVGPNFENDIGRGRLIFQPDPQVRLFAIGGMESVGTAVKTTSSVYGGGFDWKPSERTSLAGTWEERFYGASYNVAFNHRTRLTSWRAGFVRSATAFPSEALRLGSGDVIGQIDSLLARSISDPFEREQAAQRLLQQLGAPVQSGSSQIFYSPRITLIERADVSAGLIGSRNSLIFTVFNSTTESLFEAASGLPSDIFGLYGKYRTRGLTVAANHKLDAQTSLSLSFFTSRSQGLAATNGGPSAVSTQQTIIGSYNVSLSPKTTATMGFRVSKFDGSGASTTGGLAPFNERALIVGLDHTF